MKKVKDFENEIAWIDVNRIEGQNYGCCYYIDEGKIGVVDRSYVLNFLSEEYDVRNLTSELISKLSNDVGMIGSVNSEGMLAERVLPKTIDELLSCEHIVLVDKDPGEFAPIRVLTVCETNAQNVPMMYTFKDNLTIAFFIDEVTGDIYLYCLKVYGTDGKNATIYNLSYGLDIPSWPGELNLEKVEIGGYNGNTELIKIDLNYTPANDFDTYTVGTILGYKPGIGFVMFNEEVIGLSKQQIAFNKIIGYANNKICVECFDPRISDDDEDEWNDGDGTKYYYIEIDLDDLEYREIDRSDVEDYL